MTAPGSQPTAGVRVGRAPRRHRLEFRVLGGLEVDADDAPLDIGTPKQQAVLATLLLGRLETIPTSRLVESVWLDPPSAANANLRRYLTDLRRLLRLPNEPDSRLFSVPGGYRLTVLPGELDLERFEVLASQGEQALHDGHPAAAADAFGVALRLWRGRALDGLERGPRLETKVARLEKQRLTLAEKWTQIRLDLGDHASLPTDLRGLIADHPLCERLWVQLMITLCRSGRPAEALAAYDQVRELLAGQPGGAPGSELRQIHEQILRCEPPLFGPNGTTPSTGASTAPAALTRTAPEPSSAPCRLPSAAADFCGRAAERAWIRRRLDGGGVGLGPTIVAIDGAAGIGKSALALRCAHDRADRFPDGRLYVDLQAGTPGLRPLEPIEVLDRLLRCLGVASRDIPAEEAEAAAMFRSQVADQRVLIVLDDAASAAQVRPLLPGGSGCAAVITCDSVLTGLTEAVNLHLGPLSRPDAVALLERSAGAARVAADPIAAHRLVELCGRLPQALRIAGMRLTAAPDLPIAELADRVAAAHDHSGGPTPADPYIRTSLGECYQRLSHAPLPGVEANLPDGHARSRGDPDTTGGL